MASRSASGKVLLIQDPPLEMEDALIRVVLRDDQWERLAPLVPGKIGDPGRSGTNNRMFLEAVLWRVRVGAPWRDLPEVFGEWNSAFQRFRRWAKKGFDNDWLRRELKERNVLAVIPPKAGRKSHIPCNFGMYRWRHLVENFFCNLKHFRAIATRYDKTDLSFSAIIYLIGTVMALK